MSRVLHARAVPALALLAGAAEAFVNLGNRDVSPPGTYVRSKADPACWASDATQARICVR